MVTVTGERPWFEAKLANSATIDGLLVTADFETQLAAGADGDVVEPTAFTAADISASPTEAEVQAVADGVEDVVASLQSLIDALVARGVITVAA